MSNIIKCSGQTSTFPNYNIGEPQYKLKQAKVTEDQEFKKFKPQQQACDDVLSRAKEQARKIVDQAQNYSLYYMKSTTERVNFEYEQMTNNNKNQALSQMVIKETKRGFDEGYSEGLIESQKLNKNTIDFLHGVIEGIDEGKRNLLKKYEDNLKELAFAMAKSIVKNEIEIHPETLQNIIEHAAQSCKNQGNLRVIVSENNYKLLTDSCCDLTTNLSRVSDDVKIVADYNMADDDCIIETPVGIIDAGVSTQLHNIESILNDKD